jgi:multidrug resistance protein
MSFIFITLLIDVTGLGLIIPVLPKLIEELTGGNISQASQWGGWLTFAYAIMQFFCAPIIGNLSDKYGRRPVLLFSLFGFGIDYLFLAFAPTIWWLFVGRIIAGVTGASFTTASAYIADVSTPENRAKNFGLLGAAFGVGFIIGPSMGGLLAHYGLRVGSGRFYIAECFVWLFCFARIFIKRKQAALRLEKSQSTWFIAALKKISFCTGFDLGLGAGIYSGACFAKHLDLYQYRTL